MNIVVIVVIVVRVGALVNWSSSGALEAQWKDAFDSLRMALRPYGLSVEVFLWDDFHERYLISDVIGISVPAGFDVTANPEDWSTWGRLGRADRDHLQRVFHPAARKRRLYWRFQI